MLLMDAGFPDPPGLDTAISHALLLQVARRERESVLRLHKPGSVVAFGRRDAVHPGYRRAVAAALASGFGAVERLAGGRAAVFHPGTIAFSWTVPVDDPRAGINERFQEISTIMVDAFRVLGADAHVGEVPGEYCPGAHSVNIGGTRKVMGVGQRIVSGAAHIGGVVVVSGGDQVAEVLIPVYEALCIEWNPATSGDLCSATPGITTADVQRAILDQFEAGYTLEPARLDEATLALASELEPLHRPAHAPQS
ncbi:MAG: lipoate--protein ligase family protein [Gammaproteobacteria bacterium]|nr:lipoate--protein ligase family protein [Gammaproteobacteria bacterium]